MDEENDTNQNELNKSNKKNKELNELLVAIEAGDPHAAARLLPLVYDELRRLAAMQLAKEKPGQTLDAAGLVHEVYLRLAGPADGRHLSAEGSHFTDKNHFFATAAESMRRLLVDNAGRKRRSSMAAAAAA